MWQNRQGIPADEQLLQLEKDLGIENLNNVKIVNNSGTIYLEIFAQDKKFRAVLTEVV